jgi:hypothetical protein
MAEEKILVFCLMKLNKGPSIKPKKQASGNLNQCKVSSDVNVHDNVGKLT